MTTTTTTTTSNSKKIAESWNDGRTAGSSRRRSAERLNACLRCFVPQTVGNWAQNPGAIPIIPIPPCWAPPRLDTRSPRNCKKLGSWLLCGVWRWLSVSVSVFCFLALAFSLLVLLPPPAPSAFLLRSLLGSLILHLIFSSPPRPPRSFGIDYWNRFALRPVIVIGTITSAGRRACLVITPPSRDRENRERGGERETD